MIQRTRNRIVFLLIVAMFAAPLLTAWALNAFGWRPLGTRNYGALIEPARDLKAARFTLADGKPLLWKDADWSWTVFALTGPGCAEKCLGRLDELRRARLTLNQNAYRVRVVVLDAGLAPAKIAELPPLELGRDDNAQLAELRPNASDDVAVAIADPHGFLIIHYPAGYDANRMRKDLERLVKS